MRHSARAATIAAALALAAAATPAAAGGSCAPGNDLGVARIVTVDTSDGPVFGGITKRPREKRFLDRKEAVLTFDDGPMPGVTRKVLDTLDRFCTKATFFSVGRMAIAYPETVREILRRGHTLGTHTWSHPMSLPRIGFERARDQIEAGFAAVAIAAGQPIAPFFRFPGLNDSAALVAHLEQRHIATFSVDVVSNDSYITSPERLIEKTLARLDAEGGGIVLFHDIKPQTARALPTILSEMKARGYSIVHLAAKAPFTPEAGYVEAVTAHAAERKLLPARTLAMLVPFVPQEAAAPAPAAARSTPAQAPAQASTPDDAAAAARRQPAAATAEATAALPTPRAADVAATAGEPPRQRVAQREATPGLARFEARRRSPQTEADTPPEPEQRIAPPAAAAPLAAAPPVVAAPAASAIAVTPPGPPPAGPAPAAAVPPPARAQQSPPPTPVEVLAPAVAIAPAGAATESPAAPPPQKAQPEVIAGAYGRERRPRAVAPVVPGQAKPDQLSRDTFTRIGDNGN